MDEFGKLNNLSENDKKMMEINSKENQLSPIISEALKNENYTIDNSVKAFRTFKKDRFFVQKCIDKNGNEIVVKMALTKDSIESLKREEKLYDILDESIKDYEKPGEKLKIEFPHKLNSFKFGDNNKNFGIAINFIDHNKELKTQLQDEEKVNLFIKIFKEIHKLPIPQKEISKKYSERNINVDDTDEIDYKFKKFAETISDSKFNLISKDQGDLLIGFMDKNKKLLGDYPLKFDHGDLHGGNIAYKIDKKTNSPKITLMDLESLKITNEFFCIAHIANRDIATLIPKYKEKIDKLSDQENINEALEIFPNGISEKLEKEFIKSEDDRKIYILMRIYELLQGLYSYRESKTELAKVKTEILQKQLNIIINEYKLK